MKAVLISFRRYITGVLDDYMLIACILMPIIMGIAFKASVPILEKYLCDTFNRQSVLSPYYLIFDLTIAVMTPIMFAFSGVMTTLEELDSGTARYLMVTPVGRSGYLISRIGLPAAAGMIYSFIAVALFGLSHMSLLMTAAIAICCALTGIIVSELVVSFANNKVEGMALIKLSGIIILGIPAVFFLKKPIVYLCGILPSSWFTLMAKENNILYILPALAVSVVWLMLLYRKFSHKLI